MDDITVLEQCSLPSDNPIWTSIFGNLQHPHLTQPIFLRHNGSSVNMIDLYHGETCYLIGRGPSLSKIIENQEIYKLLMHPSVVRYCMNSSPEIIDYNCQLWTGVDRMNKFPSPIFKNANIMKLIPLNRFYQRGFQAMKGKDTLETKAYGGVYTACCANTIGVHSYLLEEDTKSKSMFAKYFLSSPSILYGYYRGMKSVMLFAMKIAMMLGFHKIVFLGVDFKMSATNPYYKQEINDQTKYHVDHNNNLYNFLTPIIKEMNDLLLSKYNGYNCQLLTANKIDLMPFIPVIDLKKMLQEEIRKKMSA